MTQDVTIFQHISFMLKTKARNKVQKINKNQDKLLPVSLQLYKC